MKSKKTALVVIGMLTTMGVAQKFYTFQSSSQLGSVELSSTEAQAQDQKKVIPDYKTSPYLLDAMVKEAEGNKIIVVNNIGFSAAEYGDKDLLVKVAQADLMEKAEFLFKNHGGGIIEVVAGGTTEGIGRVIGAALDKAFLAKLSGLGVTIKTNGIVSKLAAGDIDNRLNRTAQIEDPNGTWEAMNERGLRSVPELNIAALENSFRNNSSVVNAPLYVREGGGIGMREAISYIMEINRFAMEHNLSVEEVSKRGPLVLQIGLQPGMTSLELAKNKGPKAASQIVYALMQMAEASPEFRDLILKMKIQVQIITKESSKESSKEIVRYANFVLDSEEKLKTITSKVLSMDISHSMLSTFIANASEILGENNELTKEALEKKLGILTEVELKQKAKELRAKVEELAKVSPATNDAQITRTEINEIERQIVRTFLYRNSVVAYGDALPTLINEINRLNAIYSDIYKIDETRELPQRKSSILDLIRTLEVAVRSTTQNAEKFNLVVAEGGVVKAKTIVEKAIKFAKK